MQHHFGLRFWFACVMAGVLFWSGQAQAEPDFVRFYERGKLRMRQRLFFDAIKDFNVAIRTEKGSQHFAAHYHLARAYYWLPDIQKAVQMLERAKGLIKNSRQRAALDGLMRKIKDYYGAFKISPEVDPEEVGKLQLQIKPKSPFSNAHKRRYYNLFSKRLKRQGGFALNSKEIFLPKGDYEITIKKNQCLKYGLFEGSKVVTEGTIGDAPMQLSLKEKPSCQCTGGQKLYKEKARLYCACKVGSAWDEKAQICKLVRANNVPWIIGGTVIGLAVAGGVVATVVILATGSNTNPVALVNVSGKPNTPTNTGITETAQK
ncbi:MAG: tetratricopeptide repeat protein [Myxococcales bacterium]|nr:tetratricopeptide repeat protein [Myxococcales bacterium]MCB9643017.1 tetratricopeptide repeat protein [Myxococcales bacterium]